MNIAIETSSLNSGHSGRGSGIYTRLLIDALQKYETKHSYTLFTRGQKAYKAADVIHYPVFDPFILSLPVMKSKPSVVTVHDLIPLVFPDRFPAGIRGGIKWQIQKIALAGADRIITDSEASKRDIAKITGFRAVNIDVVYLAPATVFGDTGDIKTKDDIRKKYNLPEKFILYVGDVNWNKNIGGLLRAFELVRKNPRYRTLALVVVGKAFLNPGLAEVDTINGIKHQLQIEDAVVSVGYMPDTDLAGLYGLAQCLVQPSYYEGFGLPVLEAMRCGCPVIAADNSSLSEILGPSEKVSAGSSESIAGGIMNVLSLSREERVLRVSQGIRWAKTFTWRKVARDTAAVYEKMVSGA